MGILNGRHAAFSDVLDLPVLDEKVSPLAYPLVVLGCHQYLQREDLEYIADAMGTVLEKVQKRRGGSL